MAYRKTPEIEAEIARRKDRIIAATIAIVASRGMDALTTQAIATRARLSQGVIFKYFADKTEVIAAAVERLRSRDLALIRANAKGSGPAESLAGAIAVIYSRMASPALNTITFASSVYRTAIREEMEGLLLASGVHGQRSARIASAAILGAVRGIAEASENTPRDRGDAVRLALVLAGFSLGRAERYSNVRVTGLTDA